jgi:hypothetical protein
VGVNCVLQTDLFVTFVTAIRDQIGDLVRTRSLGPLTKRRAGKRGNALWA